MEGNQNGAQPLQGAEEGGLATSPTQPVLEAPGSGRAKPKQKTKEQKEGLEQFFAGNQFPSEEERRNLASTLRLTLQEVNAWFQNKRRRVKNKQAQTQDAHPPAAAVGPVAAVSAAAAASASGIASPTPSGMASSSMHAAHPASMAPVSPEPEARPMILFRDLSEYHAVLNIAQTQLPGFRPDGPPIGFAFDFPPNVGHKRPLTDDFAPPAKVARKEPNALEKRLHEEERKLQKVQERANKEQAKLDVTMRREAERKNREADRERLRAERESARIAAEHRKVEERRQKQLQKEREKQAKEAARQQAKQEKEEAKRQKAAQKEQERQQAKLAKEKEKIEKRKQREVARAQKEAEKRTKQTMKLKLREVGPPDDLDIEFAALEARAKVSAEAAGEAFNPSAIVRPPFPPQSVLEHTRPAFAGELAANSSELGGHFLLIWTFFADFGSVLGMPPVGLRALLDAVQVGAFSPLLTNAHIALLRYVQSEVEVSNIGGAAMYGGERQFQACQKAASIVIEAHCWGFDMATWRAHLNELTWPEILRQFALAAGWGPRRCRPARARKVYDESRLGEDIVENSDGTLTLRWPSRFQSNPTSGKYTMKEACWQVLADMVKTEDDVHKAKEGLRVKEIARRIEAGGYRSAEGAVVEGSVSGALSGDTLFIKVAPGQFAMHAIAAYWRKHREHLESRVKASEASKPDQGDAKMEEDAPPASAEPSRSAEAAKGTPDQATENSKENGAAADDTMTEAETRAEEEEEISDDEEVDDEERAERDAHAKHEGKSWVERLLNHEYDSLTLAERVEALSDLVHMALDMPGLRANLDRRVETLERIKKQMRDEAKVERRKRQAEMAEKARADAEESARRVQALRAELVAEGGDNAAAETPDPAAAQGASEAGAAPANGEAPVVSARAAEVENDVKLIAQQEAQRQSERELSASAAEADERERLGRIVREAELAYAIRAEAFGLDRQFNKYLWYGALRTGTPPEHIVSDRIFYESSHTGEISMFTTPEGLEATRLALEPRGAREGAFLKLIDVYGDDVVECLGGAAAEAIALPPALSARPAEEVSALVAAALPRAASVKTAAMLALKEDGEMRATDYLEEDPPAIKKIKSDMACIESAIPEQAMVNPMWERVHWIKSTQEARSVLELRRLLGELEENVRDDWLCKLFVKDQVLVRNAYNPVGREIATMLVTNTPGQPNYVKLRRKDVFSEQITERLAWLPGTSAALAWRLLCFDAAVRYDFREGSKTWRDSLYSYRYVQLPVRKQQDNTIASVPFIHCLGSNLMPPFPQHIQVLPSEEFGFDADALMHDDAAAARQHIPQGLKVVAEATTAPKKAPGQKRKSKKRVTDDDDVIHAQDISSDDDFDDVVHATYAYGASGAASDGGYTPAHSEYQDQDDADADEDEPSISDTDAEQDEDYA